ncbi:AMP-binding protein [Gordonia sp. CPCC 206044]|uniref:class I adenylate-forming enzyme family protein n=1 Tax=Gordonia sp. CPCC 206044 TaxID=3140793 RepID=UPI003AF3735D
MTDTVLAEAAIDHRLVARIAAALTLQPDSEAVEFDGDSVTWGELATVAGRIASIGREHGGPAPQVGIVLRNSPVHVAAFLGVLLAGGCVVVINPARGDVRNRADVDDLEMSVIVGTAEDLATNVDAQRCTTVTVEDMTTDPSVRSVSSQGDHVSGAQRPDVAVHMLTSGTTGPPKRVALTYDMLAHSVIGPTDTAPPSRLSSGVAIVNAPLVHIGGVFRILQCIVAARRFMLLPRFELTTWADAVRRHRPRAVSLVPTALRMVLHSDLTRDDLASIKAVTSGTAPLSAADADAFTEKFGIPVLTSYAATEFGGGVAGWTLADHREFWMSKRGSVGRAQPGSQLRVVDDDGTALGPDQTGLLEVKPGQLGAAATWIRTTDIARIDDDGFLWILGRADQAIIRGGFKIIPEDVRTALESHPAVEGACVVGRSDPRLGETPVAMVEPRPGQVVTVDDLIAHLSGRVARYEIPTAIQIVDAIPRTPSGKADLSAVRVRLDGGDTHA